MDEDYTADTVVADMGLDAFTFKSIVFISTSSSFPDSTV